MPEPALITGTTISFSRRDAETRCPACRVGAMHLFYAVSDIPVHSCLLMPTREAAVSYPTGDLRLAHCHRCGFIGNVAFDPVDNDYNQSYEETQGYSPTFSAFAGSLARRLAETHDLRGRTVLEIGCGKGEFLVELCRTAGCRGIGIDPAWRPDRLGPLPEGVSFIADLYDRRCADLDADLVICRHTLEHIADVHEFLAELHRTIERRRDVTLFFEFPDVERVLREGAFWDLYYEHCSYFSAGSLARTFEVAGFRVTDLELVYDGQYIILTAVPDREAIAPIPAPDDRAAITEAVEGFEASCRGTIERWREHVAGRECGTVVWGSGSKGVAFLTTLRLQEEITHVVDVNPHRQGRFMPGTGHRIVAPDELRDVRPDRVIVMNPVYLDEIARMLGDLGLHPELVAV